MQPNPPTHDQPHDRAAYYKWLTSSTATRAAFDTLAVLPYYSYLALTGAFLENHCSGFGTNSTPNHLLIVGGQSPTMRNPPRTSPPVWDLPSLPGAAEDAGVSWRCYCPYEGYPVSFSTQLKSSANLTTPGQFGTDVAAGQMPALSMIWHASPEDEHPPADVTLGQDAVRARALDAVAGVLHVGGGDVVVPAAPVIPGQQEHGPVPVPGGDHRVDDVLGSDPRPKKLHGEVRDGRITEIALHQTITHVSERLAHRERWAMRIGFWWET